MKATYTLIGLFLTVCLYAQPPNDDCASATFIPDVNSYCSGLTEFTNVNATPDPSFPDNCLHSYSNGVWFAFQPQSLGLFIEVIGVGNGSATMQNPSMSLFLGNCNNLQYDICAPSANFGRSELSAVDLFLGATYFLYVECFPGSEGSFQLCVTEFNPVPFPESDCPDGVVLCDKSPFFVDFLGNEGNIPNEISASCLSGESSSAWYKWTCDVAGSLEFTLTPNDYVDDSQESDDLDFVVYELPNGIDNCSGRQELRCMASGGNQGQPFSSWSQCSGPTGMRDGDNDLSEQPGCQTGNNNFVDAINMTSGTSYALVINNFSTSGLGFAIEWGGSGTFLGPEADFDAIPLEEFECDKTIQITDIITNSPDPIVDYKWSFGSGANVTTISGPGPHDIIYESFGTKLIALTITTSRGCVVTHIEEIFVEACCQDTSNLAISASGQDLICNGDESGLITASATDGNPEYSFSLDGVTFSPLSTFTGLAAGEYTIFLQDIKGCVDQITLEIIEPLPFIVDAGEDLEVPLGCATDILASYEPISDIADLEWVAGDSLSCTICPDPSVLPFGVSTYVVEGINQNGCFSTDSITIRTVADRRLFAPNIFSPLADNANDNFMVGTPKGVKSINLFIYDRWGNLVWSGANIAPNDFDAGWDGSFADGEAITGVYAWLAEIIYLDDVVEKVAGDVMLIQ